MTNFLNAAHSDYSELYLQHERLPLLKITTIFLFQLLSIQSQSKHMWAVTLPCHPHLFGHDDYTL